MVASYTSTLGLSPFAATLLHATNTDARSVNHVPSPSLQARQDRARNNMATCTLTQDEWQSLDIDSFLAESIASVGAGANFPTRFAESMIPEDERLAAPLGKCEFLVGAECQQQAGTSQLAQANCPSIAAADSNSPCLAYADPRAAIVIKNYLALRRGIIAQADDVQTARDNLVASNFVSDLLDGMAQEQGSFADEIFEFLITLPFQILFTPIRTVRIAIKAFSQLDSLVGDLIPGGVSPIIEQAIANQEIADERNRIKDQTERQMDLIVDGERARLEWLLKSVFAEGADENVQSEQDARNSVLFQLAQSGEYLNPRASDEELVDAAETMIKNLIVSATMQAFGWQAIRTFGLALEIPLEPGNTRTCREGQKGLPDTLGSPCVVFRRGASFTDPRMNNPDVIEESVDWPAMAQNADECGGGQVDTSEPSDDEDGLPSCFYNFPVLRDNIQ